MRLRTGAGSLKAVCGIGGLTLFSLLLPLACFGGEKKPSSPVVSVADSDFKAMVLDSKAPVLVDFSADWCLYCRKLAPIVDRLSRIYEGRLRVARIDVTANPASPKRFGVAYLPTILVFDKGRVVKKWVGFVPEDEIQKGIAPLLNKGGRRIFK